MEKVHKSMVVISEEEAKQLGFSLPNDKTKVANFVREKAGLPPSLRSHADRVEYYGLPADSTPRDYAIFLERKLAAKESESVKQ